MVAKAAHALVGKANLKDKLRNCVENVARAWKKNRQNSNGFAAVVSY